MNLSLAVNALGAYSLPGTDGLLVSTHLGAGEWTVEAAIPLDRLGQLGFIDVQRVRAPRPDTPELRWYWPAPNERAAFQLGPVQTMPLRSFIQRKFTSLPRRSVTCSRVAWISKYAWSEEERNQRHVSRMFEDSLRSAMSVTAEDEKRAWRKVDSREAWERFRDQRLDALRKWLGPMPERTPLGAMVTRRINYGDGFVIENIVFESRPHLLVTANLYLPEIPRTKSRPLSSFTAIMLPRRSPNYRTSE